MQLLTIGAFARLARLSPKALRLYDELDLLPPTRVDPDTGYRWYSPNQLDTARQVALLRRLDMPLARIRNVLPLEPVAMAEALTAYWQEQEQLFKARRELAAFLVDQVTGKETTMFDVSVRDVAEHRLLSISEHLAADRIGAFAAPLFAVFGGPGIARPQGARPFLRYHEEATNDTDSLVEFCCPVEEKAVVEILRQYPDMTPSTDQAGREAYVGIPRSGMTTALGFESLHQWLTRTGETADWLPRQIFLLDPATAKQDDIVYEIAVRLL